jgi:hypothetical protein
MTHKDIIEMWDKPQTLADETGQKYNTVMRWKYRNSIPADIWQAVVTSAQKHDLPVTYKLLAESK